MSPSPTTAGGRDRALLGSNVSTVGGLECAFDQAEEWACECIQVYTTPSRRWEVPPLRPERTDAFHAAWRASPVQVVVAHVPFIVNVASSDLEAWERSTLRLIEEVQRADQLRISAVVLHPGSGGTSPRPEALRRSAQAIQRAVAATAGSEVMILVENMAGQGSMLCARFEELARLLEMVDQPSRVGVCLDTAHAFIAGYPLSGYEGYEEVMGELDRIVGLERVAAVHLNDSMATHGSHHDRHAAAGQGEMGLELFHAALRDTRLAAVPLLLEVPDRDGQSLPTLQMLRTLQRRNLPITPQARRPLQMALPTACTDSGCGGQAR